MPNAQHSSASSSWYTPSEYIESAREVLGGIDLDPASDAVANETVRAAVFLAEGGESFETWPHNMRVWLNAPGGKVGRASQVGMFWDALMHYRNAGRLQHALVLAFSLELLQSSQSSGRKPRAASMPSAANFPLCIPRKRIRFVYPVSAKKQSPTHGNAVIYVPGTVDHTGRFLNVFSRYGACLVGREVSRS